MKTIISVMLLMALLLSVCACAEGVPSISDDLFAAAKEALGLLSYGEYARVSEVLPFSGGAPSAEEWQKFAESFATLSSGTVQREVSVAYWQGSCWYLAVPVSEPDRDSVEALMLRSDDGTAFSGYKLSNWGEVKSGYQASDYVVWNEEYVAGTPVIVAD